MKLTYLFAVLLLGMLLSVPTVKGGSLTGTVVDGTASAPIKGAAVSVDVLIPDSISFHATSDTTGAYIISGLPANNEIYVIRCYVEGYAPFYMRYDALASGDRQCDIVMRPRDVTPPPGGGDSATVSGIVLYETPGGAKNAVKGANVTLTAGAMQGATESGNDGRFSLRVPHASYQLSVSATNFQTLSGSEITVDSAGLTLNVLLKTSVVSVAEPKIQHPTAYALGDAYPNPFNPSTIIHYALPQPAYVVLAVYNMLGQRMVTLVDGQQRAGYHEVRFNGNGLSSGFYFYRMQAGTFVATKRLLLLK